MTMIGDPIFNLLDLCNNRTTFLLRSSTREIQNLGTGYLHKWDLKNRSEFESVRKQATGLQFLEKILAGKKGGKRGDVNVERGVGTRGEGDGEERRMGGGGRCRKHITSSNCKLHFGMGQLGIAARFKYTTTLSNSD